MAATLLAAFAIAIAVVPKTVQAQSAAQAAARAPEPVFSSGQPGSTMPGGWQRVPLNDKKTPTVYTLDSDDGQVVVKAEARSAVSMLMRRTEVDLARTPIVRWRWKVAEPPPGADNAQRSKEDSAARLLFVFDGDRDRLSAGDRSVMRLAKSMSGRELPYATLMYVTSEVAAVGTIVPNPHTRRVQMVVASSHADAQGRWLERSRDLDRDFRAAFGEAPGRLIAFGVMTDSDNTKSDVRAWYGDITFAPRP